MGHIYMLTSPSGKKYVGQTRNPLKNRLRNHCNPSSNCTALARAIKKYKGVYDNGTIANFDLVNFECPDDELDHYEQLLIRIYKTATKTKGYNLRSGGEGGSHTAETIEKIRQANLGKKHTAETRKKIGDANRNPTAETRAKRSESMKKYWRMQNENPAPHAE